MKKFCIAFAALMATGLAAGAASATVIDFAAEGSGGGERAVPDGGLINSANFGGLNLRFTGGIGGIDSDFAYLNGMGGGHSAGLAVCTGLNGSGKCATGTDDNISPGEWVWVGFEDGPFDVKRISFAGETPNLDISAGLVKITTSLNSIISMVTLTFAEASVFDFGLVNWIQFDYVNTEFVVATISDVPLPGALPLLLSGLAGLGFAASRRKKA